ncbi:hypothetical protein HHK36_014607 [Tetracentron sinense]|uniref:C2 domain-containing protein n=1 Tax=Tetracentron sinense TaxID=13715 RepID=A0A835DFZ5_TETSI|nr:hypothetical protein HHK36_014607 [Tetracentron sinense]
MNRPPPLLSRLHFESLDPTSPLSLACRSSARHSGDIFLRNRELPVALSPSPAIRLSLAGEPISSIRQSHLTTISVHLLVAGDLLWFFESPRQQPPLLDLLRPRLGLSSGHLLWQFPLAFPTSGELHHSGNRTRSSLISRSVEDLNSCLIIFSGGPLALLLLLRSKLAFQFLTKLLTEDLPRLFVRPKKIVLDFQKGKAVGPVSNDFINGEMQEGNKDFFGELSVTLVDARKLAYVFYGKTDPYVVLSLGDQIIRSKKNSQTTVIGPPGEPIWNQDFHLLVTNPRKQKLFIQVKDSLGFTDLTIDDCYHRYAPRFDVSYSPSSLIHSMADMRLGSTSEAGWIVDSGTTHHITSRMMQVELGSLQDTVPTDRIVVLKKGWGLFRKGSSGEILLRMTYKAYVEDEEEDGTEEESMDTDASDDEISESDEAEATYEKNQKKCAHGTDNESFMDVLAALLVSEEFLGIVASETLTTKRPEDARSPESTISRNLTTEFVPSDLESTSEGSGGSALFWLAVITSIAVLIAINVGGSSFFNP